MCIALAILADSPVLAHAGRYEWFRNLAVEGSPVGRLFTPNERVCRASVIFLAIRRVPSPCTPSPPVSYSSSLIAQLISAKFPRKAGLCHRIDFLRVQPRRLIAAL
jgi:hypothetical protein